jgi:hypothetical protein
LSVVVEIIIAVTAAVSALGVAAFRYLTARTFVKHANKKDIPAIAKAMYPRLHLSRSRQADDEDGQQDGQPADGEPDRGT